MPEQQHAADQPAQLEPLILLAQGAVAQIEQNGAQQGKNIVEIEPVVPFSYVLIDQNTENIKKEIKLENLTAPVEKGQVIGSISYFYENKLIGELPVMAKESVEKLSYKDSFLSVINKFFLAKD